MALELHFHGPLLSWDRGTDRTDEGDEATDATADAGGGGRSGAALGALLALAFLVGIAYAVRRTRSGGAEIEIDE